MLSEGQRLADRSLVSATTALDWLDRHCPALDAESVDPAAALGRVLAAPLLAPSDLPPVSLAGIDGYALAGAATVGASSYNPLPLRLGHDAWPVDCGTALPPGADAVLPLEDADLDGEVVEVTGAVAPGEHVLAAGRECRAGAEMLAAGHRLGVRALSLAAGAGVTRLAVVRRPRLRVVALRPGHGGDMVAALLAATGAVIDGVEPVDGDLSRFQQCLRADHGEDLLVTVGGTGAGNNDFAVSQLAALGEVALHGVAVHPGEQLALGRLDRRLVIQLPGWPLASYLAAELFAARAVRRLGGDGAPPAPRERVLERKIASRLGRLDIARVRVDGDRALPLAVADALGFQPLARADGYVLVPESSEGHAAGERVAVYPFQDCPWRHG